MNLHMYIMVAKLQKNIHICNVFFSILFHKFTDAYRIIKREVNHNCYCWEPRPLKKIASKI